MNKRYLFGAGALAALVIGVTAVGVIPQPANSQQPAPSVYYVKDGDTAWRLAEIAADNPLLWTKVVEYNPYLESRVSQRSDGTYHVLLRKGDPIHNLDKLGINLAVDVVERPPTVIDLGPPPPKAPTETTWFERNPWLPLLLTILALTGLAVWLRRHWRNERLGREYRDPVGSGPAMVQGGVTDDTVAQVFAERGRSRDFTIVGDVVRGRGYGEMSVRYGDHREERRMLNGHVVYQATVRFTGANADEQIFMLQGCGNDVRFGNTNTPDKMFRFVADEVVAPAPEPTPEPEAAAPELAVEPEPAPAPVVEATPPAEVLAPTSEPASKIGFVVSSPTPETGAWLIRVSGSSDFAVSVSKNGSQLRAKEMDPEPS